jgi:hypothetical protein
MNVMKDLGKVVSLDKHKFECRQARQVDPQETVLVRVCFDSCLRKRIYEMKGGLAHGLLSGILRDVRRLSVPVRDAKLLVDTEDRRICGINQPLGIAQQVRDLRLTLLHLGDVLADANDADNLSVRISPGCRVHEQEHSLTATRVLRLQRQLVVRRFLAPEGFLEDLAQRTNHAHDDVDRLQKEWEDARHKPLI